MKISNLAVTLALAISALATPTLCQSPAATWNEFTEVGGTLTLVTDVEGAITLTSGETAIPLEARWRKSENGEFIARCALPETVQSGRYGVELNTDQETRVLNTTVHIYPESPTNLRLWLKPVQANPGEAETFSPDILLSFVPDSGEPFEWPVISLDDPALRNSLPRGMRIGETNLLFFDINDNSNRAQGNLHQLRRRLMSKPTTIAISVTAPRDVPFRTQAILFVDDPVQALILPPDEENERNIARFKRWSDRVTVIDATSVERIHISPSSITPK